MTQYKDGRRLCLSLDAISSRENEREKKTTEPAPHEKPGRENVQSEKQDKEKSSIKKKKKEREEKPTQDLCAALEHHLGN